MLIWICYIYCCHSFINALSNLWFIGYSYADVAFIHPLCAPIYLFRDDYYTKVLALLEVIPFLFLVGFCGTSNFVIPFLWLYMHTIYILLISWYSPLLTQRVGVFHSNCSRDIAQLGWCLWLTSVISFSFFLRWLAPESWVDLSRQ